MRTCVKVRAVMVQENDWLPKRHVTRNHDHVHSRRISDLLSWSSQSHEAPNDFVSPIAFKPQHLSSTRLFLLSVCAENCYC